MKRPILGIYLLRVRADVRLPWQTAGGGFHVLGSAMTTSGIDGKREEQQPKFPVSKHRRRPSNPRLETEKSPDSDLRLRALPRRVVSTQGHLQGK